MKDKYLEILEEINKSLQEINARQKCNEKSGQNLDSINREVEHSTNQIQVSFDRIHDKVFNFNNILIAVFMVLGTFPSKSPILNLWTVIFPISNLIFMVYLEIRQMEIHRLAANLQNWKENDKEKHCEKIKTQTQLSLLSFALSLGCLIFIITKII